MSSSFLCVSCAHQALPPPSPSRSLPSPYRQRGGGATFSYDEAALQNVEIGCAPVLRLRATASPSPSRRTCPSWTCNNSPQESENEINNNNSNSNNNKGLLHTCDRVTVCRRAYASASSQRSARRGVDLMPASGPSRLSANLKRRHGVTLHWCCPFACSAGIEASKKKTRE